MGMTLVATMLDADDLAVVRRTPEVLDDLVDREDGRSVDVDKAWDAIDFLLTKPGSAGPTRRRGRSRRLFGRRRELAAPVGAESLAVHGGEPVGDDNGYGPARVLTAAQVAEVAAALESIDRETLLGRVDHAALHTAELYTPMSDEPEIDEDYVGQYYDALRSFYQRAAAANAAVVLSIV